jgi:coxsackievirus/adenovirus receptor
VEENCRPDPTCPERCRARAEEFRRSCVAAGYDPGDCAARAEAIFKVCVEQNCAPAPPCEERCRARSEGIFRGCVADGGDPDACAAKAREALRRCLAEECGLCFCPEIWDPVCGVDGRTYANACEARCAGVEIAHEGECLPECPCNRDCPAGSVCRDGACAPPCAIQCVVPDPVCGTDGKTYRCGAAEAACHGVEVLHTGECRPVCVADRDCAVGSVCMPSPFCTDACGCARFCEPCYCPFVYEPVCGVNGVTYGNACEAMCAHVEVKHSGACPQVFKRARPLGRPGGVRR